MLRSQKALLATAVILAGSCSCMPGAPNPSVALTQIVGHDVLVILPRCAGPIDSAAAYSDGGGWSDVVWEGSDPRDPDARSIPIGPRGFEHQSGAVRPAARVRVQIDPADDPSSDRLVTFVGGWEPDAAAGMRPGKGFDFATRQWVDIDDFADDPASCSENVHSWG